MILSIIAATPKVTSDAADSIGPLEVVRGVGPALGYLISVIILSGRLGRAVRIVPGIGVIFGLLALMSSIWSTEPTSTALKSIPLLFVFISAMRLGSLYDSMQSATRDVTRIATAVCLGAFVQLALIPSVVYAPDFQEQAYRLRSLVPDAAPNILGLIALISILGLILGRWPKSSASTIMRVSTIAVSVAVLLATYSRIVMVLAAIAVTVALAYRAARRPVLLSGILVVAGIALLVIIPSSLKTDTESISEYLQRGQGLQNLTTLTGRTVIWDRAVAIWVDRPALGFGYYSGHRFYLASRDGIFQLYSNIDSTWIETLVDVGVIGAIILAIYAALSILRVLPHLTHIENVTAAFMVATILAVSFINPTLQSPTLTLILFSVVSASPVSHTSKRLDIGGKRTMHSVSLGV